MEPDDDHVIDRQRRRHRIALIAGAAATTALVGTAAVVAIVSAGAGGDGPGPGGGTMTSTVAATRPSAASTTDAARSSGAAVIPTGWESHSFQGLTFAVPPGGRTTDDLDQRHGPTFRWTGSDLGNREVQGSTSVAITVRRRDGELPPPGDGDQAVTVRGAVAVRNGVGPSDITTTDPAETVEVTAGVVQVFTADAVVFVGIQFPVGPVGEQMTHDLPASIDLSGLIVPT